MLEEKAGTLSSANFTYKTYANAGGYPQQHLLFFIVSRQCEETNNALLWEMKK
ncbi:hypothetical protein [Pseudovibrio ascidiaceicola]|uniref:hypothetical protein n=1 Tax=Pseudovibrio ascidiaceicola TaxID=285279 RepID=UPI001357E03A|nr:hypothetical protein [Pseudovibrio ascidiaceicola]